MARILKWHSIWNPIVLANPLRPIVQRYSGYAIDKYIRKLLEKRFQEIKHEQENPSKASKSIVSLALKAYVAETGKTGTTAGDKLDDTFAKYATWQIRIFLFAGTDTTATTVVYCYRMLSQHPEWRKKLIQEHNEVFGPDPALAADLLRQETSLVKKCPHHGSCERNLATVLSCREHPWKFPWRYCHGSQRQSTPNGLPRNESPTLSRASERTCVATS